MPRPVSPGGGAERGAAEARVQTGGFAVVDGAIVAGGETEPGAGEDEVATSTGTLAPKATVLTNGNGIIRNSLCVGFDCPIDPTFFDSTILLSENNTRIKFEDTSTAALFPRNDWAKVGWLARRVGESSPLGPDRVSSPVAGYSALSVTVGSTSAARRAGR